MRIIIILLTAAILFIAGTLSVLNRPAKAAPEQPPTEMTFRGFMPHVSGELCGPTIDSFDDPESGWFTGQLNTLVAEYLQGEYRFMVTQPMMVWLDVAPGCLRTNYRAEIDARWAGRPGNFYALMFDIRNNVNGAYLFAVNTDKRVWLVMQVRGGDLAFIIPETGNDAILPGGQVNRLAVERRGETIYLFVNDTPVGELRAGQQGPPAAAGLAVATYIDVAPADARFDNYLYMDVGLRSNQIGEQTRTRADQVFGPYRPPNTSQPND